MFALVYVIVWGRVGAQSTPLRDFAGGANVNLDYYARADSCVRSLRPAAVVCPWKALSASRPVGEHPPVGSTAQPAAVQQPCSRIGLHEADGLSPRQPIHTPVEDARRGCPRYARPKSLWA